MFVNKGTGEIFSLDAPGPMSQSHVVPFHDRKDAVEE